MLKAHLRRPVDGVEEARGCEVDVHLRQSPAVLIDRDREDERLAESTEYHSSLGWNELMEGWARYRADEGQLSRSQRLSRLRAAVAGTYLGNLLNRVIRYAESDEFDRVLLEAAKRLVIGGN